MENSRRLRFWPTQRKLTALVAAVLAAGLASCSSAPKKAPAAEPVGAVTRAEPETYGPAPSQGDTEPAPASAVSEVRPITLVLGPGMARGLAHSGVLAAIEDEGIPIRAVYGTEMGGLIAALFTLSETRSEFEWGLLRFKSELFFQQKTLLSAFTGSLSDGNELVKVLKQTFGLREVQNARFHLGIGLFRAGAVRAEVWERGPVALVLRAALANPGVMEPSPGKQSFQSATSALPFAIERARQEAESPVVVVDVLGPEAQPPVIDQPAAGILARLYAEARIAGERELPHADLVVRPELTDIGYLDFQERTEIAYRGKRAVLREMERIRELAGLPPRKATGGAP